MSAARRSPQSTSAASNVRVVYADSVNPAASIAGRLRHGLVDRLGEQGAVRSAAVESALRAVPRHVFVPGVSAEVAYADDTVPIKRDASGTPISAASQPTIVALMLEQLDVRPGQRVLEIGAATGYNAALLAHLAGEDGRVTTVEVDDELVEGARVNLAAAGYGGVRVVHGDGALGCAAGAPYDRIIATVGAYDLPPAWLEQLAEGGRLVAPLRLRGSVTRSVVLERDPHRRGVWRAVGHQMCGFMPLRGGLADDPRRVVPLTVDASVTLHTHQDQTVDPASLSGVLDKPRHELWTGVRFGDEESFEWLWLWLACTLPNALSRMPTEPSAIERGLVKPSFRWGTMATTDRATLAYLSLRSTEPTATDPDRHHEDRHYEVGVIGHGPDRERLAGHVADQIRTWHHTHRTQAVRLDLQAVRATPPLDGQFTFITGHQQLALTWV